MTPGGLQFLGKPHPKLERLQFPFDKRRLLTRLLFFLSSCPLPIAVDINYREGPERSQTYSGQGVPQ